MEFRLQASLQTALAAVNKHKQKQEEEQCSEKEMKTQLLPENELYNQ